METKILLIAFAAVLALTGCSKDSDTPEPVDIYAAFKADATPRWESGSTVEKNEKSSYIFIIDADGNLFSSANYKTGRILSSDGSNYEFIEFSGSAIVGKPSGPSIRRPSGNTPLNNLEIVKVENGKLWIVFKETATSTERFVVQ